MSPVASRRGRPRRRHHRRHLRRARLRLARAARGPARTSSARSASTSTKPASGRLTRDAEAARGRQLQLVTRPPRRRHVTERKAGRRWSPAPPAESDSRSPDPCRGGIRRVHLRRSGDDVEHTSKELREDGPDVTAPPATSPRLRTSATSSQPRWSTSAGSTSWSTTPAAAAAAPPPTSPTSSGTTYRHQPQQRLPGHPRGAEPRRHRRARTRADHQHRLHRGQAGRRAGRPVLRLQARRRRLHQGAGQGARPHRHHRQRRLPRLRRDPDGRTRPAGLRAAWDTTEDRSRSSSRRRSPSAATPRPRRSPAWSAYLASGPAASITAQALNVCGGLGNY